MGVKISALGKYLPKLVITNKDFEKLVDTTDEWITQRTGIVSRHIETELLTWQMGAKAAEEIFKNSDIKKEEIDMVIVSSCTSDYLTPSAACLIAKELGLEKPACYDINCACSGFVAAIDMAETYLSSKKAKKILIVSAETLSKITDYTDRSTCVLFGDAAGACVVEYSDKPFASEVGSDPSGAEHLYARGAFPNNPFLEKPYLPTDDGLEATKGFGLHQDGKDVYKFATRTMPNVIRASCEKAGIDISDLDWVFPHQANQRILETSAKNTGMAIEKFYINIKDHGNVSSACIPICLEEAVTKGVLKRGDKICIVGFGAGLTYAAAIFEW